MGTDVYTKDQSISKCLLGIFNSSKKGTKKFNLTTMVTQVELFSFVFGRIGRHQKDISEVTDLLGCEDWTCFIWYINPTPMGGRHISPTTAACSY